MGNRNSIIKLLFIITIIFPVTLYTQTVSEKPYSLEKDLDNRRSFWEQERIKSPSDSLINKVLYTLRNGNEDEIMNCFQLYIRKIDNRSILDLLDSLYLTTDSEMVMKEISSTLRFHDYKEFIPDLIIVLEYRSVMIRYNAACTLAALGEKEHCLQTLREVWDSVNWQKKQGINRALRNIGSAESIDWLIKNTKDEHTYVGCGAAICLAQIGYYNEAFPVLKDMLLIDERKVGAINGLAYIGDKKSLELIKSMIYDKNSHVRSQSRRVLKAYGYNDKEGNR